jgi:hypothetical protein
VGLRMTGAWLSDVEETPDEDSELDIGGGEA